MKAKQPLLLVAFVVVMLVTLRVVPGLAFAAPGGSDGGKPVNWVTASFVTGPIGDIAVPTLDVIHVWGLQDGTVRGTYLDRSIGKPGQSDYRFTSRSFESAYWDEFLAAQGLPSLSHAYFCHGADYPEWLWPSSWWMGLPPSFTTFADADVADFVVYVPADQLDPAWRSIYPDSMPLRYVLLDFGEPGRENDRYMAWAFLPLTPTLWLWAPMTEDADPVPVRNGNIQVHVGAPDF